MISLIAQFSHIFLFAFLSYVMPMINSFNAKWFLFVCWIVLYHYQLFILLNCASLYSLNEMLNFGISIGQCAYKALNLDICLFTFLRISSCTLKRFNCPHQSYYPIEWMKNWEKNTPKQFSIHPTSTMNWKWKREEKNHIG